MTIYLTGSINLLSQEQIQREAERYAANGWEYRDPTTHRVSVQVAQEDIEAFCDYLRNRPLDRQPKVWRDRDGNQHQTPTVTFFLNGSEMTGNWIRLRSALNSTPQASPQVGAATTSQPVRRTPAPAPVRRAAGASAPAAAAPPTVAVPQPRATPEQPPVWNSDPLDPEDDDDFPPF
jgi:hypothetical protein